MLAPHSFYVLPCLFLPLHFISLSVQFSSVQFECSSHFRSRSSQDTPVYRKSPSLTAIMNGRSSGHTSGRAHDVWGEGARRRSRSRSPMLRASRFRGNSRTPREYGARNHQSGQRGLQLQGVGVASVRDWNTPFFRGSEWRASRSRRR